MKMAPLCSLTHAAAIVLAAVTLSACPESKHKGATASAPDAPSTPVSPGTPGSPNSPSGPSAPSGPSEVSITSISEVVVTLGDPSLPGDGMLIILGLGFQNADSPTLPYVQLGSTALKVQNINDAGTELVAILPDDISSGDYRLLVERSLPGVPPKLQIDSANVAIYDLTLRENDLGPQGIQGEPGPAGPPGTQVGPAGAPGPQGATGPDGDVGPAGIQGETGLAGPRGPMGPAGLPGLVGLQGATGVSGQDGAVGPGGDSGPVGPRGETGLSGPPGPDGAAGLQGPAGAQGLAGAAGPAGVVGPRGVTGPPGLAGETGIAGPPGSIGLAGLQGPPGSQGSQGQIGAQGPDGGPCSFSQCTHDEAMANILDGTLIYSCPNSTNVEIQCRCLDIKPTTIFGVTSWGQPRVTGSTQAELPDDIRGTAPLTIDTFDSFTTRCGVEYDYNDAWLLYEWSCEGETADQASVCNLPADGWDQAAYTATYKYKEITWYPQSYVRYKITLAIYDISLGNFNRNTELQWYVNTHAGAPVK